MRKVIGIVLVAALVAGCYYDNEENLYPVVDQVCDTTGVSFSKSIIPILQANCYKCHSAKENANSGGNINFEDFNVLKQMVDGGVLYGSVTWNPLNLPMPKDGAKLDTCSITKIKIWIDKGAPNN